MFKMRSGIPNAYILDISVYKYKYHKFLLYN